MLKDLLLNEFKEQTVSYSYVDSNELFVKGGINIVYGEKNAGKTYSVLKYLKNPVFIDYDMNAKVADEIRFVGTADIIKFITDNSTPDDIVVIDHLDGFSNGRYMSEEDATAVVNKLKAIPATVILLAHATVYRTAIKKSVTFRGNDKIGNNADTVYSLIDGTLKTEKRRGGSKVLVDWMR